MSVDGKEQEDDCSNLLDGTFPVELSEATQKRLGVLADWDIYILEPLKRIHIDDIHNDLSTNGEKSDFYGLQDQIKSSRSIEPLLIYDPSRRHGCQYLLCLNDDSILGYMRADEDEMLALIDKKTPYVYASPEPRGWDTLGSEKDIEGTWVKDTRSRIRLQVRRSVPRKVKRLQLSDRNVSDVKDGYVACESYTDSRNPSQHASVMDRAIQAVPTVVEGVSQTELKHPKNIGIEYEARVFNPDEVVEIWKSPQMQSFLKNAEKIMEEVSLEPDIMGSLRPEIEAFYRRDEVVVIEETSFVHKVFFSDLIFTRDMRVSHIRWHPSIPNIVAMSVAENLPFEEYLENQSKRLAMPNVISIWSMEFPFFPQILLRITDDITKFEWHPHEPETLVGGAANGQLLIWDIGQYIHKLRNGVNTWDHKVFLSSPMNKLHIQDGFIPILHWSAESSKEHSHLSRVEYLQWLPNSVWFSHDSAYPKQNQFEDENQLISCDGDRYVCIWALRDQPTDGGLEHHELEEMSRGEKKQTGVGWEKLKLQSSVPTMPSPSGGRGGRGGKKYSPAVGKYEALNKVWRPVHKICFLDPYSKHDDEVFFQVVITSMNVIDRPDLIQTFARKDSVGSTSGATAAGPHQAASAEAQDQGKTTKESPRKVKDKDRDEDKEKGKEKDQKQEVGAKAKTGEDKGKDETKRDEPKPRKNSDSSHSFNGEFSDDEEEEEDEEDPAQFALPTFLMAGTIFGAIFRVDLTKVKVDVETNDLICTVDWEVSVHDGPVTVMERSPHNPHLLLTMGGYCWAIWNEGDMNSPVVLHYVEDVLFTNAAWSLAQPNIIFFSDESGQLQVWDLTHKKAEPKQVQGISGRTINAICPYAHRDVVNGQETVTHFISVGDETGTLHVLILPKHLYTTCDQDKDDILEFIEQEIEKKIERKTLQQEREEKQHKPPKKTDKEEFDEERHVEWEEENYLKAYFKREKMVVWNIYGTEWKKYLAFPELPRKKYYTEEKRRDSSEERRRQKEITARAKKKKGGSIFRKYD